MSTPNNPENAPEDPLHKARREKLHRLEKMGVDPWGERLDDIQSIGDIRRRIVEVKYQTEDGVQHDLPDFDTDSDFDFRQWMAETGKGELLGPEVRAAGRIVLSRDKGKLKFIDIRDQTGQIQLNPITKNSSRIKTQ